MNKTRTAAPAAATDKHAPFRRIFLTGGSGFVGRNIIRHFVERHVDVVALVRSDRSADCVRALGATPYRGEMLSPDIASGMISCDAVIHAAADTGHGIGTAMQILVNEEGTRIVMAAALTAGIRKAIHISTESVLATGKPLVKVDETVPLPRKPAGSYSRSKLAAERIALASSSPEFPVVVLRPRFVWGRDDSTALPALIEAARSGKLAWIGGGTYLTSTTHIVNLCTAIELALANGRGGEIYFISDGEPVEFRTFVSALLETQGIAPPRKSVPRPIVRTIAAMGDLIGAISKGRIVPALTLQAYATSAVEVSLNISKAQRELSYAPPVSREEGLDELRSAYRP
ncbi:NAD-dependent epimerase/dehydratase family protein [Agrobacterium vitis]|uniref:NAD-dependent epimerase/dehydratase family protein n=1 Tax=Rhizobium/Agrobacterium group TaxID=227290 RepID=UPI0012E7CCB3|nr:MULTISPECIES: NAD-dependent epimerase/dehydratase family protein [Rhizobium/Agrobacterium group]MCF1494382.1 NAD-dependent epimerase/dehydratase family protein [Allorhizobium ampelinum]MVA45888.1 NAD-dependent epimerase/dehydratase family protein [Agrobacterium vitis]